MTDAATFNQLLPLLTYSVLMSGTPGPNNIMLTASGANFGYGRTLPHIVGLVLGQAPQIMLACIGLGAVFERYPGLHRALQLAGAAYLMVLAWQLMPDRSPCATGQGRHEGEPPSLRNFIGASLRRLSRSALRTAEAPRPMSFWQAVAFQSVNPKAWVKALTVASVFMPPQLGLLAGAALVTAISMVVSFPCISMWALFGVAIRRLLTDARRRRVFNVIMAASLFALALTLVT